MPLSALPFPTQKFSNTWLLGAEGLQWQCAKLNIHFLRLSLVLFFFLLVYFVWFQSKMFPFKSYKKDVSKYMIGCNRLCSWLALVILLLNENSYMQTHAATYPWHPSLAGLTLNFVLLMLIKHTDATGKQPWPEVDCFTMFPLWNPLSHSGRALNCDIFLSEQNGFWMGNFVTYTSFWLEGKIIIEFTPR